MRSIAFVLLLVGFLGCSNGATLRTEPTKVAGKLASTGGQAVGNVGLTFQPLDAGFMTTVQVAEDGSFQGELVPGKYSYFIVKSSSKTGDQALKKIDAKFLEANMSRTIEFKPGQDLALVLE